MKKEKEKEAEEMINMISKILEEKVRAKTIEIGAQDTEKDLLKGLKNV